MSSLEPVEQLGSAPRISRDVSTKMNDNPAATGPSQDLAQARKQVEVQNQATEKPKKLSKIQQLAKDRAAMKKAAHIAKQVTSQTEDRSVMISEPHSEDGSLPSNSIAVCDEKVEPDAGSPADVQTIPAHKIDDDLRLCRELAEGRLAKPSAFAITILGAPRCSGLLDQNYADRVFSCFTVGSDDKISKAKKSFAQPSPDDIVQKAQAASKGKLIFS